MPLYVLGLMGMTRRMQHYDVAAWHPWLLIAAGGAAIILLGIGLQIAQLVVSIRRREELRDETGDPWNGRSLEWATPSPPPAFNFAVLPNIQGEEAYWGMKQRALQQARLSEEPAYADIEVPRNSPTGFVCAFFATIHGFRVDLAHLVDGGPGRIGRLRDLRRLCLAGRGRVHHSSGNSRAHRSGQPKRTQRGARPTAGGAMTAIEAAAGRDDPNRLGHDWESPYLQHTLGHAERGLASKRIITAFGFWIFLVSDIIMFSAFFATYAVLVGNTAGGPSGRELFNLPNVALETAFLLVSSFTCGLASIGARAHSGSWFYGAMAATFILGAGFLSIELREFASMVARGAGPTRSAFLSAFFTLVGCHGLHITAGLLWLLTMMAQVFAKGYRPDILRRMLCFSLFWHALDIIWVAIFTVVYLMGVAQ